MRVVRVCPDDVRRAEVVDIDRDEVREAAVAAAREPQRADLPEVIRMVRDLHRLEVRPRVQRVLRLREVDVPDRWVRIRLARAFRRRRTVVATGVPVRVDEIDVRIEAVVRLVVDEVDLAGITGDHPREDRGVASLVRQVDRLGPRCAEVGRERVVDVLLAEEATGAGDVLDRPL